MNEPAGDKPPTTQVSAEQLALLIESVSDYAIFMLTPEGVVASWNKGAQRIKGYAAGEIIGEHFSRFYPEDQIQADHPAEELEIATREGRFEEEGWRVRKDGSQFWANVVITAIRDASGALVGFGKVTRDLTARRLNEEQLRSSAAELRAANRDLQQFRLLVAGVEDYAIYMLDPGGHVVNWNLGAERLKGYTADEAVGRHFSDFYLPEDRLRSAPGHALEAAARDGRYGSEGWRVRKDGSRFWAGVTVTAIRDDHGRLAGYAKITRDLTERKIADDALMDAQTRLLASNEDLQHLAAAAAHDLADPLQTISGFAELLLSRHGKSLDDEAKRFVETILGSTGHMRRLVNELAEYAGAGEGELPLEPADANAAARAAVQSLQGPIESGSASVEVAIPEGAHVLGAQLGIERVFQNLISNAVKYGGDNTRVEVSAAPEQLAWRFFVTDNGPGIEEVERRAIFQPFRRVRGQIKSGSGLGLAICQKTVERYGGEIGVEPAPSGQGSRFWFTLPAA